MLLVVEDMIVTYTPSLPYHIFPVDRHTFSPMDLFFRSPRIHSVDSLFLVVTHQSGHYTVLAKLALRLRNSSVFYLIH